jgi:hypothetical protein
MECGWDARFLSMHLQQDTTRPVLSNDRYLRVLAIGVAIAEGRDSG